MALRRSRVRPASLRVSRVGATLRLVDSNGFLAFFAALLIPALLIPALLIPALCGRYAMRTPGMNIAAYHEAAFQK